MTNTNYPSASSPQNRPENAPKNNNTKNIAIAVLAAALLGTWGYFLYDKNQSTEKIASTQTQATYAISAKDSVQLLYNDALTRLDSITGSNNNLQGELGDRQTEITKLKNEINQILRNKNASDADLTRARRLIGTLNDKIQNLEVEVARLTGENQQLNTFNTVLREEKAILETNLQTAASEREELAKTVDVASTFTAYNIEITPVDERKSGKEKVTTTAKRVDKLVISFDVLNRVARTGPADLYVVVKGPDGKVIMDPALGSGTLSTRNDGEQDFTSKITTEYEQGAAKHIRIPLRHSNFQTGDYHIQIFQNGFKIAEGTKSLKKGGLFG